ncbi:MAG: RNA-binding protein [Opitutales bacterium]|nr:RNA-binding protein [Opitutales bacterium]
MESCRVDKWLWATRLYKTRSLATAACKAGKVKIDGANAKAARTVTPGVVVTARKDGIVRTVKVIAMLDKRVGAKLVPDYLEDLTPVEEYEAAKERNRSLGLRQPRGAGRPTKRRRRMMDKFFGKAEE